MHPLLLFFLAITIPVMVSLLLLAPTYFAMWGTLYLIYGGNVVSLIFDIFRVTETYFTLLDYWWANMNTLSFIDYTLPIVGLPSAGILVTAFITWKFSMYVVNIFRLST